MRPPVSFSASKPDESFTALGPSAWSIQPVCHQLFDDLLACPSYAFFYGLLACLLYVISCAEILSWPPGLSLVRHQLCRLSWMASFNSLKFILVPGDVVAFHQFCCTPSPLFEQVGGERQPLSCCCLSMTMRSAGCPRFLRSPQAWVPFRLWCGLEVS